MSYNTKPGDTFDLISRKVYGDESGTSRLRGANPGVIEPIPAGVQMIVPQLPKPAVTVREKDKNLVAVTINGSTFRYWESIAIVRALDAVDSFSLNGPWDPERQEYRDAFRPFGYARTTVSVGGEPVFTGTMVDVAPKVESTQRTVSVSGYAVPGVLWDCTVSGSYDTFEFNDQTLEQIARVLVEPFAIPVVFTEPSGAVFERVSIEPDGEIGNWLVDLAKQANMVVGSGTDGSLEFRRDVIGQKPVARLTEGVQPLISVIPRFSPQDYFSSVTGVEPLFLGMTGAVVTRRIPGVDVFRPHTFVVPDAEDSSLLQGAVDAKVGRMYANAVSYQIQVPTWRTPGGQLWAPGQAVTLTAPASMVYRPTTFTIRSVTFERSKLIDRATIDLMLPGSFAGLIPGALPWQD